MYDGRVACPYAPAGGVDVETCYRCRHLRGFYDDESGTKVVCSTPRGVFDGLLASLGSIESRLHRRV
jgi:hypothetical protein